MVLNVYAVFDSKVLAYFPPFFSATHPAAIREFTDKVNTPNHPWARHPEDFSLFAIGTYDDNTAVITPMAPHITLGKAVEYVSQPK